MRWGYWAVVIGLLGENMGLPLPGETVLVSASFLSHKSGKLNLIWIIIAAIAAAIMGDNAAYWLGHKFGATLIRWLRWLAHLDDSDVAAAKDLIRRRGPVTIFFARFIFGLRTVAGLLAGMLEMEWRRFAVFNALGAVTWVTTMSLAGYVFADEFDRFVDYLEWGSWIIASGLLLLGYLLWRRHKRGFKKHHNKEQAAA